MKKVSSDTKVRNDMRRPSDHELYGKLKTASEAASAGRINLVEPTPILADLTDLDILPEDLVELIPKMVAEIGPQHYRGKRPPEKSYEVQIKGGELYAFRWMSKELGCIVYFKFALKEGKLWIASLHADRTQGREGA